MVSEPVSMALSDGVDLAAHALRASNKIWVSLQEQQTHAKPLRHRLVLAI